MDIEELKRQINNVIDQWAANPAAAQSSATGPVSPIITKEETPRELPKDKRVVRTKTHGDRVYLFDEVAKTRQWIAGQPPILLGPDLLVLLGFEMSDVVEVNDMEFLKYEQGAAITKAP